MTEQTLRRYLGADFAIASFGEMMTAFSGRAITSSDAITWESFGHARGAAARSAGSRGAASRAGSRRAESRCRHDRDPGAQAAPAPHIQRVR